MPVWSRGSPELLYLGEDGRVMAAAYSIRAGSFVPEKPHLWTPRRLVTFGLTSTFDLAPNGQRIACLLPGDTPEPAETLRHVMMVLNFFGELR